MQQPIENLFENLRAYKRKYYVNKLIRGAIIFLAVILVAYLLFTSAEFYGNFNTYLRTVFFFSFIILSLAVGYIWIGEPVYRLFNLNKQLSDEEAAKQIGGLLPDVQDKLLNTLQLSKLSSSENELVQAGIAQKTNQLSVFKFSDVIKFNENRKYLRYLLPPFAIVLILLIFIPQLFTEGTRRIVKYNQEFIPTAPFQFKLENASLEIFKNEDFEVKLLIEGNSLPESAYISFNGRKHKMDKNGESGYTFIFKKVDKSIDFKFEAAGFNSSSYALDLKARPVLNFFDVKLSYPAYLNKKAERLNNVGNLLIPEGTQVTWIFDTEDCESLFIDLGNKGNNIAGNGFLRSGFEVKKQVFKSDIYSVHMNNKFGVSKEKMEYSITVILDEYPKIFVDQFKDTTLFNYLVLVGNISDDYGLSDLKLFYKRSTDKNFRTYPIKIAQNQNNQSYYFRWDIDSLNLKPGETLEYHLAVWDNDGINGHKSAKSKALELRLPSDKEMQKSVDETSEAAEKQISSTLDKAEELKKEVKKLEQRLKSKKSFDWQDKKALDELLKKQEALQQELQQLQEKHKELVDKKDRFDHENERIAEKTKLLQQLMKDMLDEDTKKLYQELAKLLQEKNKENEMKEVLEKLKNKDQNIEKELDRALEMFKQLKFESKLEDMTQKLDELAKKQDELAEKSLEKNADNEKLKEEQDKLNQEFDEAKKEKDELEKMNEELENKKEMEDTEPQEKEISEDQQKSSESLEKKESKKANKSQKKAAQNMKQMADNMKKMQESMEMDEMSENMEDLRAILENLITLSYDQEEVMKEFKKVNQTDPRFIQLSQRQLKLKDDSKIIEDSLNALAKRVFQIQSFITRELDAMNQAMDESATAIKARRSDVAAGKQQFAMTSMNNLALLLSDVMKQMQEQMNEQKDQKGNSKGGKKKKKGGDKPSLSQMQKKLNQQIDDLKKSGMSGKKLSEELAKLAHQQEQIRKAMNNMEGGKDPTDGKEGKDGKNGGQGQGEMEKLKREMEKTEGDLVNKQITQQTLNRQQEILSRLLEHEKAQREREQDPQRESQTAKDKNRQVPISFENYLKEKEKQIELLKTIPPNLNPYFKREATEYFQKIGN